MMKEYGWRVPEAQRANLIMVEENMTALENGVQASTGERMARGETEGKRPSLMPAEYTLATGNLSEFTWDEDNILSAD